MNCRSVGASRGVIRLPVSVPVDFPGVALKQFCDRALGATSPGEIETLRALIPAAQWQADEVTLAHDFCDQRIYALTGHALPGRAPVDDLDAPLFLENSGRPQGQFAENLPLELGLCFTGISNFVEEKNFFEAHRIAEGLVKYLRRLELESKADEAGVVRS